MSEYQSYHLSHPSWTLPGEGAIRIAPALAIPRVLAEMGLDADQLIAGAGLDRALFDDPDNVVSFTDLGRFVAICTERTRCPHFGLEVCRHTTLDILGLVGELARHSRDVGGALRNIILYLHLHDRGAVPNLSVSDDHAMLSYAIHQPDVPGTVQIYDGAIANTFNIIKSLAGPDWQPTEVLLSRPRPADCEPYRSFFRTRLTFDAEYSAVVFDASWLDRPLGGADAQACRRILQEIDMLETKGAGDLETQLRRVLRRILLDGARRGNASLGLASELFCLHRRTLNRRLRAQGTTFRTLINEARFDIARQLLRDTSLSVAEIAAALDYSESSSFVHAFRRWSGTSPSAWRAVHPPTELSAGPGPDEIPTS